jgi:hypothetical protein
MNFRGSWFSLKENEQKINKKWQKPEEILKQKQQSDIK